MHEEEIPYQLDQYIKGRLSEKEKDRLWEAFLEHPEYLEWLVIEVNARDYIQNIERGPELVLSEPADGGFRYIVYSAAVILLALTGLLWFLFIQPNDSASRQAISSIDYPVMVTPELFRASGEDGDDTDPLDVSINAGMEAALSGRHEESMTHFNSVLAANPDDVQEVMARFNRGVLRYNLEAYDEASEDFRQVAGDDAGLQLTESALWYLGHSLLQKGEADAARDVFNEMISMEGPHLEEARSLLERLD